MNSCGSTSMLMLLSSWNAHLPFPVAEDNMNRAELMGISADPVPGIVFSPLLQECALFFEPRTVGVLGQPEHDEFGGLHRCDTDIDGEDAHVPVLRRVVLLVTLDVERLFRTRAEQRPAAPDPAQEHVDGAFHRSPEPEVVRLENGPVRAVEDRLLHEVEQPPHVQVAPLRVAAQRARAPDPDALAGEGPDAVDPDGVELV